MIKHNLPQFSRTFINVLHDMSDRDRNILIDRFVHRKTQKEVSIELKVTPQWIKAIEDKIIEDINKRFKNLNM